MSTHHHSVCHALNVEGANAKGVGCVLFKRTHSGLKVLLGKEAYGQYAGQYSLCAGEMDLEDNGCYMNTIKRELWEEFKLRVSWRKFDEMFMLDNGDYRVFVKRGTPIFVGFVTDNVYDMNSRVREAFVDRYLPRSYREMENLGLFDPYHPNPEATAFATSCIRTALEMV